MRETSAGRRTTIEPPPADAPDPGEIAHRFADPAEDRAKKRGYLRFFPDAGRVLDIGCGDGVFLELLRETGVDGVGLDHHPSVSERARARGLEVRTGDAVDGVAELVEAGERFSGVLCSHLVEHLPPDRVPALFSAIASVLSPHGRAAFVTPNPKNLIVLTETFWLDPTHVRPWPRRILEELGRSVGLEVEESFDDPATTPRRPLLKRLLAWFRSVLSGADRSSPLDSVVVFRRP